MHLLGNYKTRTFDMITSDLLFVKTVSDNKSFYRIIPIYYLNKALYKYNEAMPVKK